MPALSLRLGRLAVGLAACAAAAGCGSFDSASARIASAVTPYRAPVVQGNFVSREQVEALRPGVSRQQVRELLGTPLVASVFHENRWDYVFTLRRTGAEPQSYRLTLFFKDNVLERMEGDQLPTEAQFLEQIDTRRRGARIPVLEATEEQLRRFGSPAPRADAPVPAVPEQPPVRADYPPLEPVQR
ncbi:outer membrane protein assembly factor BamE [Ramlibacter sp. AN1015]|uniref:outer membrane protein assembly factor BamE n=1 Tax=Ramlibacter sp. AN1015 TaxID=3133428 RepID=UPI0030C4C7B2